MSRNVKAFIALLILVAGVAVAGDISLDSERLDLETRMQKRVAEALSQILPPGQFVVVIRVEPLARLQKDEEEQRPSTQDAFYLPGVPAITKFDGSAEAINKLSTKLKSEDTGFQKFIRKITVTLVLDKDLPEDTVGKVRELTRQMLSLDPQRGDTLDIQRLEFPKVVVPVVDNSGFSKLQQGLKNYWVLISLSLIIFSLVIFFLFIFGPIRGFLNRLVQILPTLRPLEPRGGRLGDDAASILPAMFAQSMGMPPPQMGMAPSSFSGSLQVENPNKRTLPFGFIREDHLSNLAVLLSRETPEKAAVVLGYLPTEWLTRVLAKIEPAMQTEITNHLATTRQLLPEQVEDIEQDLKRRLDYLIGGPDRIIAVYETLDAEGQKRMLDNLKETRPEIATELRARTFLFEDLEKLESSALKSVLREVDLQTLVSSMKGISDDLKARIFEHLPEGKAEIVREELDLNDGKSGGKATLEAQRRISLIARRLDKEGQIQMPSVDEAPSSRYGSLRSTLKLPAGLRLKENESTPTQEGEVISSDQKEGIQDRIRRFMNRRNTDKSGRFPLQDDTLPPDEGRR